MDRRRARGYKHRSPDASDSIWARNMNYSVAVVGATGNVGREMLSILSERRFPAREVHAIASRRSLGTSVAFGEATLKCKDLVGFDFSGIEFCLMSAGASVSREWSPKIAAMGCVVIDNSSAWRFDIDVPLIVPEVNADAVADYARKNIIANPNCSTAQMVVALKPLHDRATIKRVVVATYQSVSGAGKEAMNELWTQTKGKYVPGQEYAPKTFPKEIAFNCIPQIDVFMEDGYTREEWKMVAETKKILDPRIKVTATCVRVPVFVGHSEALSVEFAKPISAEEARQILREAPGCLVIDTHQPGGYVTPMEASGEDATYISRIREDTTVENGLAMWVVADNLRKGAALNAVQIAELMVNRNLLRKAA
jgi:aspartate-semialdehyde dehydrogenase